MVATNRLSNPRRCQGTRPQQEALLLYTWIKQTLLSNARTVALFFQPPHPLGHTTKLSARAVGRWPPGVGSSPGEASLLSSFPSQTTQYSCTEVWCGHIPAVSPAS